MFKLYTNIQEITYNMKIPNSNPVRIFIVHLFKNVNIFVKIKTML